MDFLGGAKIAQRIGLTIASSSSVASISHAVRTQELGIERISIMFEFGSKKAQKGGHERPAMLVSILSFLSSVPYCRNKSLSQYDLPKFCVAKLSTQTVETLQQLSMQHCFYWGDQTTLAVWLTRRYLKPIPRANRRLGRRSTGRS